ncbi:MAG TPA: hypothetical protein VKH81_07575 [Candidatus Angelobacter sp.]|nr:hypothetical protein [Candidatus Angelobacter sp.]
MKRLLITFVVFVVSIAARGQVQSIITTACNNGTSANVPKGTYTITATITVPCSNIMIYWDDVTLVAGTNLNDNVVEVATQSNITFRGRLKIDGNKGNQTSEPALGANGLLVDGATNFNFDTIEVTDTWTDGLKFVDSTKVRGTNLYVSSIGSASRGGANGFKVESIAATTSDVAVTNIHCDTTVGQDCVFVVGDDSTHRVSRVVLGTVTVINPGDEGVEINNCDGCSASTISVSQSSSGGIGLLVRQSTNCSFGSVVVEGGAEGVHIGSFAGTDLPTTGISIASVVVKNVTGDPTNGAGVKINQSTGTTVRDISVGTVVSTNNSVGLWVVAASKVSISNLTAAYNNKIGLVFQSTAHVTAGVVTSYNNGQDPSFPGTKAGVYGADSTDIVLTAVNVFDDQATKTQNYGVITSGTSNRWTIAGCDCQSSQEAVAGLSLVGANNQTAAIQP